MERKRFTAKRYPAAASILSGAIPASNTIPQHQSAVYNDKVTDLQIKTIAPHVNTVDIITQPFIEAVIPAWPSLVKAGGLSDILDFKGYGSYIYQGLYSIYLIEKQSTCITCVAVTFMEHYCIGYSSLEIYFDGRQNKEAKVFTPPFPPTNLSGLAMGIYLFKSYADIESKILPAGGKGEFVRCMYKNDLPSQVTILNCNWFTDLHKNSAFSVRGHFRLQPCGPGNRDRKIRWINEYGKQGYHAHAVKDKQDN